ncbi:calcium-binding protein [Pseudorhodobacter ferrugineus]|uniref:calcium-binding protein n=1 Tax=Pseudorhodobacter ferrugineus TaxID=77008 RepID=UPI0003B57584|nr:hypothetical protein [Pseudorhodobacter ferrugineus]
MEFLLLLLVPVALGALFSGDGDDSTDTPPNPETDDNDVVRGVAADDTLDGGDGSDLLFGYRGDDTLSGGAGDDLLDGGLGDDQIFGGAGEDVLVGAAGDDSLQGGRGDDALAGGAGDDTLDGGDGDDVLNGSTGSDVMYGGAGDDVIDGVSPTASRSLEDAFDDVRDEFSASMRSTFGTDVTDADIGRFLNDFASEEGTHGADALFGGAGNDQLIGNDGDTLTGGAGNDSFGVNWVTGNDPVAITDYDTTIQSGVTTPEALRIFVDDPTIVNPVLGLRDAADGSGVEVLVGLNVVANLQNVDVADINLGSITMGVTGTTVITQAIRL